MNPECLLFGSHTGNTGHNSLLRIVMGYSLWALGKFHFLTCKISHCLLLDMPGRTPWNLHAFRMQRTQGNVGSQRMRLAEEQS